MNPMATMMVKTVANATTTVRTVVVDDDAGAADGAKGTSPLMRSRAVRKPFVKEVLHQGRLNRGGLFYTVASGAAIIQHGAGRQRPADS